MPGAFAAFLVASAVIVAFPGPDTLVVIRALLSGGRRHAARTAAGVLTGLGIWVCAAALGISALLAASHVASLVLRLAGGAYLVVIGVRALLSARRGAEARAGRVRASLLVVASERVTRLMTSRRARRRIDGLSGLVLVGFGIRLAIEG